MKRADLIIGCGAAGSAIALEALEKGAGHVSLMDLIPNTAIQLADRLCSKFRNRNIKAYGANDTSFAVIINATPLGSHADDKMHCNFDIAQTNAIIADTVTDPYPTKWIAQANANGSSSSRRHATIFRYKPVSYSGFSEIKRQSLMRQIYLTTSPFIKGPQL